MSAHKLPIIIKHQLKERKKAMFSFAKENGASLTEFFYATLEVRNKFVLVSEGPKWAASNDEHFRLEQQLAPVLLTASQMLRGIHAQAFVFENCVVKTNLFGQYYHDGQRQWLEWCAKNQDNPLLPKVALLLSDDESDRFLVVMEKLVCHSGFHHHMFRKEIDDVFKQSFESRSDTSYPTLNTALMAIKKNSELAVAELEADIELMVEIEDPVVEQQLRENLLEHQITLQYIEEITSFWRALRTVHADEFSVVSQFWDTLTAKKHEIDVHSLNWMLRQNGEQVLLDPVN